MTFRWRVFWIVSVAVGILAAIAWASWCPPFYLENDDVTIRMTLEGRTVPGGSPTGLALFTHALFGWGIVALARAVPTIPWWDVTLAALLLWSLAVLLALAWDALGSDWLARSTAVVIVLLAIIPLLASFQFTISSTLAGGAAMLLAIEELGARRPRTSVLAMALLLFAMGLLMRLMGAAAGAMVAATLRLPTLQARQHLFRVAGAVAAAGLLCVAAQYLDLRMYGASGEWNEYYRYNWMVALVIEWSGDLSKTYAPQIRASVGWSANDWLMLVRAWGVDPAVHGFERVSRVYQTQTEITRQVGAVPWLWSRALSLSADDIRGLLRASVPIAFAGTGLSAYGARRGLAAIVIEFVVFLAFCYAVQVTFDKLPWRLLGPLEAICLAAVLLAVGAWRRATTPLVGILVLGGLLAVTAATWAATVSEAQRHAADSRGIEREVVSLNAVQPSLVILYGSRFPREYWWRPFHHAVDLPSIALGYNGMNPQLQHYLSATGRQPLLRALCSDPSILVVADRDPLDLVTIYMQEHFNTPIEWTRVYDGSFSAWRCSATNARSPQSLSRAEPDTHVG